MLKMKQSIIYILILSILSSAFGPQTFAYGSEENQASTAEAPIVETMPQEPEEPLTQVPVTSEEEIARDVEEMSTKTGSFGIDPESASQIEKALSTGDEKKIVANRSAWDTLQSMITSFVILAIGVLQKKARQENLNLVPDNEKALSDSVSSLWPVLKYVLASVPGGFVTYKISKAGSKATERYANYFFSTKMAVWISRFIPFFNAKAAEKLFKYFVSAGLLSIGSNYVKGFVTFAVQEVLAHPEMFGGVTNEERATLEYLQQQAGFGYFLMSLGGMTTTHYGDKVLPGLTSKIWDSETKAKYEAFFNIDWKVFKAMSIILAWDSQLRTALWHHLTRQAFLQGGNGLMILASVISDFISESIKWLSVETAAPAGWDKRAFIISVVVGLIASFVPDRGKDMGTVYANEKWASWQAGWVKNRIINKVLEGFNYHQPEEGLVRDLKEIFKRAQNSRENRFVKFAYLAMLSLQRTANVKNDEAGMLAHQIRQAQGAIPQPQGFGQWLDYIFRQTFDFMPDRVSMWWDKGDVPYYKSVFQDSINNMMQIYLDDTAIFQKFADQNWPPAAKTVVSGQLKNFQQMEVFINYLNQTLSQEWGTNTPSIAYTQSLGLLEKVSFWGIRESDVLKVFISGPTAHH